MTSEWEHRWETRPLERGPTLFVPTCKLTLDDGTAHQFEHQRITIGSAPDNDLVLADDTVSRVHAQITRGQDRYLIRDLDSTNGTRVNGVPVREATLVPDCTVEVGGMALRFASAERPVETEPLGAESFDGLVGRSDAMRRLFSVAKQVASSDVPVLLQGETGTGKEVVAQTIHRRSRRQDGPFVVVDCSAIPENLIEAELFGHEKGAFSGAQQGRVGLVELAHGGTLFLDEVGELPRSLQPKFLRVLEAGTVRRVGGRHQRHIDFRLVTATHRDLSQMVADGRFRADLYYRINVIPLVLPPLRERREDIAPLIHHFLSLKGSKTRLTPEAHNRLNAHIAVAPLEGNVRELRNLVERLLAAPEAPLGPDGQGTDPTPVPRPATSRTITKFKVAKEALIIDFERQYLATLLAHTGGNLSAAARVAELDRKYLRELVEKHKLR